MPVASKRAVGSSEPSAYERFHSTFQAAVTQEKFCTTLRRL